MAEQTTEKAVEDLVTHVVRSRGIHENPAGLLEFDREDLQYLAMRAYLKGQEDDYRE